MGENIRPERVTCIQQMRNAILALACFIGTFRAPEILLGAEAKAHLVPALEDLVIPASLSPDDKRKVEAKFFGVDPWILAYYDVLPGLNATTSFSMSMDSEGRYRLRFVQFKPEVWQRLDELGGERSATVDFVFTKVRSKVRTISMPTGAADELLGLWRFLLRGTRERSYGERLFVHSPIIVLFSKDGKGGIELGQAPLDAAEIEEFVELNEIVGELARVAASQKGETRKIFAAIERRCRLLRQRLQTSLK